MFNRVSLAGVAESLNWGSWEMIKKVASDAAGFIPASSEEKDFLQQAFKAEIAMGIDNINLHSSMTLNDEPFIGRVVLSDVSQKSRLRLSDPAGNLYSTFLTSRVRASFVCPDCESSYSFPIAVKFLTKDSPFCKKCCKSVLHRCESYVRRYEDSMIANHGVSRPLQKKSIREKMIDTMVQRYGVAHSSSSVELEDKRKNTLVQRFGRDNPWRGINPHVEYNIRSSGIRVSRGERELVDFLDSEVFRGQATRSYKNTQKRFVADGIIGFFDYYVESHNLAVEFFGDYFHANPAVYPDAHVIREGITAGNIRKKNDSRLLAARSLGTKVFVVWERDWELRRTEVMKNLQELINDCR